MSDKNTKAATRQDAVQSFGCRLNSSESAAIKDILQQSNLQDDVFVINSCAVTNQTESDIIRFVKKLKRENPDKKIISTYYPGILIRSENIIVEVQSDYTYSREVEKNNAKFLQVIKDGYTIHLYVFNKKELLYYIRQQLLVITSYQIW